MFTGPTFKLLLCFTSIPDIYNSFIRNKTTFTKYLRAWYLPSKEVVPGKFYGSRWYSKHNCLQDRANFHRSRTCGQKI